DPAYRPADVAHEIVEPARRAEVEREDALARDDVLGAWPHRDLADGADGVAAPLRQRLDREDHLARACEGVRARGHRGRARVVRAAAHGHAAVEDPDDVAHQAEWEPAVEPAALGHRVEVRADDSRGAPPLGPRGFEMRPEIRSGVAAQRRATCAQPAADELARLLLVLGQTQARDRVAAATDPRELGDAALEPRAVAHRAGPPRASARNPPAAN